MNPDHHFFLGLDLGLTTDPTALAIIHRWDEPGPRNPVTWEFQSRRRYDLRYAERLPLGRTWTAIIDRVKCVLRHPDLKYPVSMAVDATSASAVMEMLDHANLGIHITPVIITPGEHHGHGPTGIRVPRHLLLGALKASLESGDLRICPGMMDLAPLTEELSNIQINRKDKKDDLCFAVALALWRARLSPVGPVSGRPMF